MMVKIKIKEYSNMASIPLLGRTHVRLLGKTVKLDTEGKTKNSPLGPLSYM